MDLAIGDEVTIDGVGRAYCTVVDRKAAKPVVGREADRLHAVEGDDWILEEVDGPSTRYRLPVGETTTREGCDVERGHNGQDDPSRIPALEKEFAL